MAGNRREALKGDRKGRHSIRINQHVRICFKRTEQGPARGEITHDHRIMNKTLPLPTPGEMLREEFLEPLELSAYPLAKDISVPQTRLSAIWAGKRASGRSPRIRGYG